MKTNYKPFDLEAAKAGAPIICRDGIEATFVAYTTELETNCHVLFIRKGAKCVNYCYANGLRHERADNESPLDLFMAPMKFKKWINVDRAGNIFGYFTRTGADNNASPCRIACVEIEYEEGQGL